MAEKRHPGISMHKLTIGEGFGGLVFTIGSVLIFVIGLPALWYFVAFGTALGIAVAVALYLSSDSRSLRAKPLSILQVAEKPRHIPQGEIDARELRAMHLAQA